jgi:hypothetical protein
MTNTIISRDVPNIRRIQKPDTGYPAGFSAQNPCHQKIEIKASDLSKVSFAKLFAKLLPTHFFAFKEFLNFKMICYESF